MSLAVDRVGGGERPVEVLGGAAVLVRVRVRVRVLVRVRVRVRVS